MKLHTGVCLAAIAIVQTSGAIAQAPASGDAQVESASSGEPASQPSIDDIVVTGSRTVTNGEKAPTPVTVMGAAQLRDSAPTLTEALRQLPQLTGSSSPSTATLTIGGGPTTQNSPNLRNLGANRTLTLLNGRRPPVAGGSGTVDTGIFPQLLIKRVDIVTGGASATYGSDAISGVINYIVDTDFVGVAAEARGGLSSRGDAESFAFEIAGGAPFAGGAGHIVANVNVNGQNGLAGEDRAFNRTGFSTIPNPNAGQPGQPTLLLRENVTIATGTFGGRITTPALSNIQFDANGAPIPYTAGTESTGALQVGGDGARYSPTLVARTRNWSAFVHTKYEVSDAVEIFAEGSFGHAQSNYPNLYFFNLGSGAYTVSRDNAYLPASVGALMDQNGLTSIQLGKVDLNYGRNETFYNSDTFNLLGGFKAKLSSTWVLDGYVTHSESKVRFGAKNNRIQANSRLATDAVIGPNGTIVCRSTLTNPGNGCVPTNPFGIIPLTDAQSDYLTATSEARSTTKQDVGSVAAHGDAFEGWAGPVVVAFGAEYRKVSLNQTADPIGQANGFTAGNLKSSAGSYNVKEVFGEVQFPLLKDVPLAQDLSFNGALRRTDYSTSGAVTTWKVGLTDEVFRDFRLRATYSQDIRAPNIAELFGGQARGVTSVRDPNFGNAVVANIFTFSGSNSSLRPETARTLTLGGVYRPSWLPGLGLSVDYYRIKLSDAIATLGVQTIVDQCAAGTQLFCGLITRDSAGRLVEINASTQNVQSAKISGLDFEANYQRDVGNGSLSVRALATYLQHYQFANPGTAPIEQAGTTGVVTYRSLPRWRGNLQATYNLDRFTISLQERFIGSLNRSVPPVTVDDNRMKATFYTNMTARYSLKDQVPGNPEIFLSVSNLFDQKPRVGATNSCNLGACEMYDGSLYDLIGRYFTLGVRARF